MSPSVQHRFTDTGSHAALRSQLEDQRPRGRPPAATLRRDLEMRAYPRELLDADQLTSFEVVESAYGWRSMASPFPMAIHRSATGPRPMS